MHDNTPSALDKRILFGIIAIAIIARGLASIYLGNQVVDTPGAADQISYHTLAVRFLNGHNLTFGRDWWPATAADAPTAHWSYLYTFYLIAVYTLFGPHPLAARLIQIIIVGILQPLLTYAIARRLFNDKVGLIAAALSSIYLYFIYYSATLMTEPFYITATLGSLYIAILLVDQVKNLGQKIHPWRFYLLAVAFGLILGSTVLLRQLFLLIIPFIFAWVWWASRVRRGTNSFTILLIATVTIIILILPFTAFNYARFERFVLLNTNAGYAFFWGNHPVHGTNFIPARQIDNYVVLIPPDLLNLDEAALDQALLQRGLGFITADPTRYILLSLSRIPAYFMFWPSAESSTLSNITRVGSFGLAWPLMLLGIGLWFKDRWSSGLRQLSASPGALLLLYALVYTGIHLLTWALIRYRLPVDAILLVFAAHGIAWLISRLKTVGVT